MTYLLDKIKGQNICKWGHPNGHPIPTHCHDVPLSLCPSVLMLKCLGVPVSHCSGVPVSRCLSELPIHKFFDSDGGNGMEKKNVG